MTQNHTTATTYNRCCLLPSSTRWEAQQTCKTVDEAHPARRWQLPLVSVSLPPRPNTLTHSFAARVSYLYTRVYPVSVRVTT